MGIVNTEVFSMHAEYRPRIIDKTVTDHLGAFGAVCIEGPKWCGKTWTASQHAKSEIYLDDPRGNFQNRQLAELDPSLVLEGAPPRLIDEWQTVPALWDAIRHKVDENSAKGQFLLTGSSVPKDQIGNIMHSGAGRIARLRMRPMSLFESGFSTGEVSLRSICYGSFASVLTGEPDLSELAACIVRGGWPGSLDLPFEQAVLIPEQYIAAVLNSDILHMDDTVRSMRKMELLLRALARNESSTVTTKTLIRDISASDGQPVAENTVIRYLDILKRLFLTEDQPPYSGRLRSASRVRQAPKRHFCDPSLACSLLGAGVDSLLGDLETFGLLFEALCIRDLRIYAESFGGHIFHYRDYNDREIDAVIELPDHSWVAVEIKLGAHQIDQAAASLQKTVAYLTKNSTNSPPRALCVLCGMSNAAYRRPDGVYIVPLTALRN